MRFLLRSKTNASIETEHFQTAIAVYPLYLLPATVNCKIVQLRWINVIQILKYLWLDATETRPIWVDLAFSCRVVEIDTPAPFSHHAEIQL
jgi:hypothetical protein